MHLQKLHSTASSGHKETLWGGEIDGFPALHTICLQNRSLFAKWLIIVSTIARLIQSVRLNDLSGNLGISPSQSSIMHFLARSLSYCICFHFFVGWGSSASEECLFCDNGQTSWSQMKLYTISAITSSGIWVGP